MEKNRGSTYTSVGTRPACRALAPPDDPGVHACANAPSPRFRWTPT